MLVAEHCSAAYDDSPVFSDIALSVDRGRTLAVVGPSGCGKTTLLLVLAGLKVPRQAAPRIDGEMVRRGDPRVGLVLQNYGLFPWFSVLENVVVALRIRTRAEGRRPARPSLQDRARDALDHVGLSEKAHCYPGELSGGEQQRVALARTLVNRPQVLLLDEPFSALDALTREAMQDELLRLLADEAPATVMVTHSIDEAVYVGDTVGIMTGAPAVLTVLPNPAGPRATAHDRDAGGFRTTPLYARTCAATRSRFREAVGA